VPGSAESSARDARFDPIDALNDQWQRAQNQLDFAAYSAPHAPSFQGTKRVAERSFQFDRKRWLFDRAPMFKPGLKLRLKHLELKPVPARTSWLSSSKCSTRRPIETAGESCWRSRNERVELRGAGRSP
jgi:hypothetical protein